MIKDLFLKYFKRKKKNKIFCLSVQRTGTTSVGVFFKRLGYDVADWEVSKKNGWTQSWFEGDYQGIFKSKDFKNNTVFEDAPWFSPNFYKFLYQEYPDSKFILLYRNPEDWFQSMMGHSGGKSLGNTLIHSKIYGLEDYACAKYPELLASSYSIYHNDNLLDLTENKSHYIRYYKRYINEVESFFFKHSRKSLFTSDLYDKNLWLNLGKFTGHNIQNSTELHENRTSSNNFSI